MPSEQEQLEKQRYEQDVNYIPPPTWEHEEPQQTEQPQADEDGLDAAMEDYYYSAFDRRDEMEAEGSGTTSSNPVTTPKDNANDEHTKEPSTSMNEADIFSDEEDLLEAAYQQYKATLDQKIGGKSQEDGVLIDSEMTDI